MFSNIETKINNHMANKFVVDITLKTGENVSFKDSFLFNTKQVQVDLITGDVQIELIHSNGYPIDDVLKLLIAEEIEKLIVYPVNHNNRSYPYAFKFMDGKTTSIETKFDSNDITPLVHSIKIKFIVKDIIEIKDTIPMDIRINQKHYDI